MRRSLIRVRAAAFVALCIAVCGCSLSADVNAPGGLVIIGGDAQIVPANTVAPTPLEVIVVDQFGVPMEKVTVNWTIASGGGSLRTSSVVSDVDGKASVVYTAGPIAGKAVINAQVSGLEPLSFDITIS
jgi:hypothetical protein